MRQPAHEKHLRQLLALQDRERRLLACEIHDGFVQSVVAAQIAIDSLLERLLKSDPESVDSLLQIRAMIRQAIDEARGLVGDLRPPNIDDLGLAEAIQFLIDQEEVRHRLAVQFSHNLDAIRLDPLLQSSVVRIVQEALNNVAKHAKSKEATVELNVHRGKLRVVITDHGIGFNSKQVPADRYGVSGIRERARMFGGKATIRSRPGEGTRVTVEFSRLTESRRRAR